MTLIVHLCPGAVACEAPTPRDQGCQLTGHAPGSEGPLLATEKRLGKQEAEQESRIIHEENMAIMQAMSHEEIMQAQQELLAQLGKVPAVGPAGLERLKKSKKSMSWATLHCFVLMLVLGGREHSPPVT